MWDYPHKKVLRSILVTHQEDRVLTTTDRRNREIVTGIVQQVHTPWRFLSSVGYRTRSVPADRNRNRPPRILEMPWGIMSDDPGLQLEMPTRTVCTGAISRQYMCNLPPVQLELPTSTLGIPPSTVATEWNPKGESQRGIPKGNPKVGQYSWNRGLPPMVTLL
jgi:hypothetical protein